MQVDSCDLTNLFTGCLFESLRNGGWKFRFAEYVAGVQTRRLGDLFREDKTPVTTAAPLLRAARFQTVHRQPPPSIFVRKSIRTILRVFFSRISRMYWVREFSNFPIAQQIRQEVAFEGVIFKSWYKNGRNMRGAVVKITEI